MTYREYKLARFTIYDMPGDMFINNTRIDYLAIALTRLKKIQALSSSERDIKVFFDVGILDIYSFLGLSYIEKIKDCIDIDCNIEILYFHENQKKDIATILKPYEERISFIDIEELVNSVKNYPDEQILEVESELSLQIDEFEYYHRISFIFNYCINNDFDLLLRGNDKSAGFVEIVLNIFKRKWGEDAEIIPLYLPEFDFYSNDGKTIPTSYYNFEDVYNWIYYKIGTLSNLYLQLQWILNLYRVFIFNSLNEKEYYEELGNKSINLLNAFTKADNQIKRSKIIENVAAEFFNNYLNLIKEHEITTRR